MMTSRRFATRTLGVFAALVLASCFGESTGPDVRRGHLALAPAFDVADRRALKLVNVDRVHLHLTLPGTSTVVLDTTVIFPANADTLDLSLSVPITGGSQTFDLVVDMLDPSNNVVFHSGPSPVVAT